MRWRGINRKTYQRQISEHMVTCNGFVGHLGSDPAEFDNMHETNRVKGTQTEPLMILTNHR